jgi:CheY-like chemotaxis protein
MPEAGDSRVAVLLVEDSPDDADLMLEALQEGALALRADLVEDGEQALNYLRRCGADVPAPLPGLILLDLHLPRKNGHEVLAEIKAHPQWKRIPVVILTSSVDEKDVLAAYDQHANCYVTKPDDQEQFALVVKKIEQFWLRFNRGP